MATDAGTGGSTTPVNPLELSDEDFLKMTIPTDAGTATTEAEDEEAKRAAEAAAAAESQAGQEAPEGAVETPEGDKPTEGSAATAPADEKGEGSAPPSGSAEGDKKPTEGKDGKGADGADPTTGKSSDAPADGDKKDTQSDPPDYEAFYKTIMSPIRANGKTIELRSPEEAVKLMQMGANFTKKMQEIAPHRKVLTMLQNNNLLDESRLSFLIDLDKKNPEAIKKLLKDSGVDPLEIDTTTEPAYLEGSHRVTDEEVNFRAALEDLGSTPEGKETLQAINTRWDQSSKELLWKHPETLALIDQQRQIGIYGRISDEIDRRVTLGLISPQTPFLEAYRIVGNELTEANGFADLMEKHQDTARPERSALPGQGGNGAAPQPVATRVATPKPQVSNDDRASAASPTRASSKPAQAIVNLLAMSDDEFLKQFNGRL